MSGPRTRVGCMRTLEGGRRKRLAGQRKRLPCPAFRVWCGPGRQQRPHCTPPPPSPRSRCTLTGPVHCSTPGQRVRGHRAGGTRLSWVGMPPRCGGAPASKHHSMAPARWQQQRMHRLRQQRSTQPPAAAQPAHHGGVFCVQGGVLGRRQSRLALAVVGCGGAGSPPQRPCNCSFACWCVMPMRPGFAPEVHTFMICFSA